ncbi:hypothetical protein O181_015940 [Austropuccinia psidii MF-1]|uniref:WIBG Mago-binding domain-containing protein n=1 Tax=Austropuccinia psidii MF-1 TaxID=1389203 RepID=A0A9Q3C3W8_9BASI|nr:hypothetical protein [Austropuccinia psidii MF-1]
MASRPPLLSELKPSNSGIIRDPNTGDRKVAPTKRPDGTFRKEIKIRPGFTPQEDLSKFRSSRQQESDSRKLPKGSVIGFIKPESSPAQMALKGMSEAQKKNAKRKEKRKANVARPEDQDTPENWDHSSTSDTNPQFHSSIPQPSINSSSNVTSNAPGPTITTKSQESLNPSKSLFQSALKSSSANPPTPPIQHLVPSPYVNSQSSSAPLSNSPKRESGGKGGVKLFESAMQGIDQTASTDDKESAEKRARGLRKKLLQAEQLKTRSDSGETLLPEQLDKISKIDELQLELKNLNLNDNF